MAVIGGVNLGALTDYLFVFTDGSTDANWQGATKGYVGNVAVDGIQADERTSGGVPYAGTIFTNDVTLGAWQDIVDQNPGQATGSTGNVSLIAGLETDLANAFTQINALPVTPGFESRSSTSLNGLDTTNGVNELIVINVTSGFGISSKIHINGDPGDVFVLRWDEDANPANGYQGNVKFQSGGAIVPGANLTPSNFIHVAGDINSSGGGSTPPPPYPQGPRLDDGQGALINGGQDFSGGGFFTGYWLTTGNPVNGSTGSLSNAIFVGGWYTSTDNFSMTSGTSGVYTSPNPATLETPAINMTKKISVDGGTIFVDADTPPFPVLFPPNNPVFRFTVTNTGNVTLTDVAINDSALGIVLIGGTLAPGASTTVTRPGIFGPGQQCNIAKASAQALGQTVTNTDMACYYGAIEPSISLIKLVSVNGGISFEEADTPPGNTLTSPTNPVYRFVVTNTGTILITGITLIDSVLGPVAIPMATLAPGKSFTAEVIGTFAFGQNCNTATVSGMANGQPVSDAGTACYAGVSGAATEAIKLVSVDGGLTYADAHSQPFPVLVPPNNPLYQFVVTNTGTITLTDMALVDSHFGPITLPGTTLAPGELFTVDLTGTFGEGDQCNTVVATGTGDAGPVTATDFACYTGVEGPGPAIGVQKLISADGGITYVDADLPPGPALYKPANPVFRYVVTNTGSVQLTLVAVNDNVLGPILIGGTLDPGQSVVVSGIVGAWQPGQHTNIATATGVGDGQTVTDTDPANYQGLTPGTPTFPDISNPAPQNEIIDRLLETIALEELSLAALINAEAEKVQAVAAAEVMGPVTTEQLTRINISVAEVIKAAALKEERLEKKLARILAHKERPTPPTPQSSATRP